MVLEAIDSDVIKTYVRLGLGVGIVAEMAVKDARDADLVARPLGKLLGQNVARIALKRGAYLRDFVYHFASLLSDRLDKELILKAMSGHVADYDAAPRPTPRLIAGKPAPTKSRAIKNNSCSRMLLLVFRLFSLEIVTHQTSATIKFESTWT